VFPNWHFFCGKIPSICTAVVIHFLTPAFKLFMVSALTLNDQYGFSRAGRRSVIIINILLLVFSFSRFAAVLFFV
jgi:hypothetical protein